MNGSRAMRDGRWTAAGWRTLRVGVGLAALAVAGLAAVVPLGAQAQMPDPRQMSGIPRPVSDLPDGTVDVRVIRGSFAYNALDQAVTLQHVGKIPESKTVHTDSQGRAAFSGFTPGAMVQASTTLDGERLTSQTFPFPAQGGIRLLLVGKLPPGAPATPVPERAVPGAVVFGPQSRIVMDPGDGSIKLYYLLYITNSGSVPVMPASTLVIDVPPAGEGTTLLNGSTPQASASGNRITVPGPFPPGETLVQIGTLIPYQGGTLNLSQRFPVPLEQVAVVVKKYGNLKFNSPQVSDQRDLTNKGDQYIAATGPAVPAGQPISLTLSGLPHRSQVPLTIALGLVVIIVAIGVWSVATARVSSANDARRQRLDAQRERVFNDLVKLEEQHRASGGADARYQAKRGELVGRLERIYRQIEDETAGPGGGDEGLAA